MSSTTSCPDAELLQQFVLGQLDDASLDALAEHLEQCPDCARVLRDLPARDPLVHTMQRVGPASEAPLHEEVSALIRKLQQSTTKLPSALRGTVKDLPDPLADAPASHDWLAPPQAPDELGRLDSYRVCRVLGSGGMGIVFQAEDSRLRRHVALKVLKPGLAANSAARRRFFREARAMAALAHDHVVHIYQVGEDRGIPFLAMELLHGETLDERLKRPEPLSLGEIVRLGAEVAEGLAAAHEHGLIHRDLKPANIFLVRGKEGSNSDACTPLTTPKILDFGLARLDVAPEPLTEIGTVMGTPTYMAPEQAHGDEVDARADLFSLGCVLYRMCAGVLPFRGSDTLSRLASLLHDPAPDLREVNPHCPAELAHLVGQLLSKTPAERPASARAVARRLGAIHAQLQGAPPLRRRGGRWAVAAGLLLLLTGGLLLAPILIRIDTNGKETTITVPEGSRVKIEQGGKVVGTFPARPDPVKRLLGPLDRLDPVQIPAEERFPWQPQELVAILGAHRGWHPAAVRTVAFSPDGKRLASGGFEGTVRLWDAATLRLQAEFKGHTADVMAVAFSPDGQTLAAGLTSGATVMSDIAGREVWSRNAILTMPTIHINTVAFAPDSQTLATGGSDCLVKLWDVSGKIPRRLLGAGEAGEQMGAPTFHPDGKTLAVGALDGTVRLWDLTGIRPKLQRMLSEGGLGGGSLTFAPDGKTLASWGWPGPALLWDLAGAQPKVRAKLPGTDHAFYCELVLAPDGRGLVTAQLHADVQLWDLTGAEPKLHAVLPGTKYLGRHVALAPDGKLLALGGNDRNVRLWDVSGAKPRERARLPGHTGNIRSLAFAPDGRTLASASYDGTVRLWDLTGTEPKTRAVLSASGVLAFAPDGKRLASVSGDGRLIVWQAATGAKLKEWTLGAVGNGVVFAPDSRHLATTHANGTVYVFRLDPPPPNQGEKSPR